MIGRRGFEARASIGWHCCADPIGSAMIPCSGAGKNNEPKLSFFLSQFGHSLEFGTGGATSTTALDPRARNAAARASGQILRHLP